MGRESKKKKPRHDATASEPGFSVKIHGFSFWWIMGKKYIHVILIIAAGILSYGNSFEVPFHFDDFANIVENPVVRDWDTLYDNAHIKSHPLYMFLKTRFVGYLTFALNYGIHGLDVNGYHAVNIFIHIVNALLIYLLIAVTFKTPFLKENPLGEHALCIAMFSGLIFVSHPIQTQAVTYIVQRFTSLATMFYLISFLAYISWRLRDMESAVQKPYQKLIFYIISLVSSVLAMKTKEIAFTLPLAILLYEYIFFGRPGRRILLKLAPILLTILIIPATLLLHMDDTGGLLNKLSESTRVMTAMPRDHYLATQFRVLVTYLRLIVLPFNQSLDYDYPVFDSLADLQVILAFLFLHSMLAMGAYLYLRSKTGDASLRLVSFGIFWFFLTNIVESGIIPISDVIFEHRVYLPSIGIVIAGLAGLFIYVQHSRRPEFIKAVIIVLFISQIGFAFATHSRNHVWNSDISLWSNVVENAPKNTRAHNNLGYAYFSRGLEDNALRHYEEALALNPSDHEVHNNMGALCFSQGKLDRALEHYKASIKLRPKYAEAHNNIGIAYNKKGLLDKAIEHYNISCDINPFNPEAHNNLGISYNSKGMMDKAHAHYIQAIELNPDFEEAHNNLGLLYLKVGNIEEAQDTFEKTLEINPENLQARQFSDYISNLQSMDD